MALLVASSNSWAQQAFPDRCGGQAGLPFAAIAEPHPIDRTCALRGKRTSPANVQLQNSLKNNFCAAAAQGKPETFTVPMLVDLQRNTPVRGGEEPRNRTPLQQLGEGKLIRLKGFLIEAHHANVGSGETVNCNGKSEAENDVHIALGAQPHGRLCDSVTAEIGPHFRPSAWNEIGHFEVFNTATQRYIVNHALASRLQAHPYRITGQLFFDASHEPCGCGAVKCSPPRASLWEIHPVYQIEVCRAGSACDENNDGDWLAFDRWWKSLIPLRIFLWHSHSHPPHERRHR